MVDKQYEFKIIKDQDVETFKKDFDKVDTVKLDLKNNKLHKVKFEELFERLAATRLSYFLLDLTNYDGLDNDKVEAIINCIRNWNLKTLILCLQGVKLNDNQFNSLFYESIRTMTNLENLYIDCENAGVTRSKLKSLEHLLPKLNKLSNIFLNLRNNNIEKEEVNQISKEIQHIPAREFLF